MSKIPALIIVGLLCISTFQMLPLQVKAASLPPVGYWKLDEGSGTVAGDTSGNGNNGVLMNDPQWVDGKVGKALQFDGIDDSVSVPDSPSLKASGSEISVELWFRPTSTLDNNSPALEILDKGNEYTFILNLAPYQPVPSGKIAFLLCFEGAGREWVETTTDLWLADTWYHLAGIYDGAYLRIYVNGILQNSVPFSGSLHSESYPLSLGSYTLGSNWFFSGALDEVKLYNCARNAEEIWNDYQSIAPVGGFWVSMNKLELLAPWISSALLSLAIAASFVCFKRFRRQQA